MLESPEWPLLSRSLTPLEIKASLPNLVIFSKLFPWWNWSSPSFSFPLEMATQGIYHNVQSLVSFLYLNLSTFWSGFTKENGCFVFVHLLAWPLLINLQNLHNFSALNGCPAKKKDYCLQTISVLVEGHSS